MAVLQIMLGILMICVWSSGASAENGPLGFGPPRAAGSLASDRPDFTEGPGIITPGHYQLEGGYEFAGKKQNGRHLEAHAAPLLLLRAGILEDLELRFFWNGYVREDEAGEFGEERLEGAADLGVEIKHFLYEQEGYRPDIAILLGLEFPTGSGDARGDDVQPALKFIWAYDLSELYAIGGNINFAAPVEDKERYFETSASLSLGRSLGEQVGSYVEYFGFYPNQDAPDTSSENFLAVGFTYAVDENLQLDAYIGTGLGDETADIFVGTGFAWRH